MESKLTFNRVFYVLGSSGFAREVKSYIVEATHAPEKNIVFVDKEHLSIEQYWEEVNLNGSAVTILGSGKPEIKVKMAKEARGHFFKLVHPASLVSSSAAIDNGSVIAPGAVIAPHAVIGEHVLVNYNATVGHDAIVGSFSVISPNSSVGGWVTIGERSYIGSGAQIREKLTIGDDVVIGMGAVVTKDIPANHIAIGVPARAYDRAEWNIKE